MPGLIVQKNKITRISDEKLRIKINEIFKDYPTYKKPKKIIFINMLPKTKNGKKIRDKKTLEKFFKN